MAGILARIIMGNMMKNKENREHYIPRDYSKARAELNRMTQMQPCPRRIRQRKEIIGGVPCFWFEGPKAKSGKVILYIHGGGFNSGSAEFDTPTAVALTRKGEYPVLSIEYRLAPENPFPAGLMDCAAVYQGLLEKGYQGRDIVLLGGSAGGNLVFALALYLRDHQVPLPAGLCGMSPVGTLDDTPPSRKGRVHRDCIIGADFTEEMEQTYMDGHSASEPYLSPAYGCFDGLPPIWICVGTEEVFYDDALMLKEAAQKAHIPAELIIAEGMCHSYPAIPDKISRDTMISLRRFIADKLG